MRAAFGFSGQKCSANSRVYVERPVHDELVRLLVEKTEKLVVGDPLPRTAFTGPVIDERAVNRHQHAVSEARRDGTVFTGGERLTDGALARGFYVEPTVVGPAGRAPAVPGRAVRAVHGGRAGRLAGRGTGARQRQHVRADGRRVQRGAGRGPAVPRGDPGGRRCTSTGAPARRRARGRASRRSAAGRAPARPASPACRCTTSPVPPRAEPHDRRLRLGLSPSARRRPTTSGRRRPPVRQGRSADREPRVPGAVEPGPIAADSRRVALAWPRACEQVQPARDDHEHAGGEQQRFHGSTPPLKCAPHPGTRPPTGGVPAPSHVRRRLPMTRWLRALLPPLIVALGLPVALARGAGRRPRGRPLLPRLRHAGALRVDVAGGQGARLRLRADRHLRPRRHDGHVLERQRLGAPHHRRQPGVGLPGRGAPPNGSVAYTFDQGGRLPVRVRVPSRDGWRDRRRRGRAAGLAPQTGGAAPAGRDRTATWHRASRSPSTARDRPRRRRGRARSRSRSPGSSVPAPAARLW